MIQIEFVHDEDPSIVILIEALHLPTENSLKFMKIKQLCRNILSSEHVIYCWGDTIEELKKFTRYNIFNNDDINQIEPKNTQSAFKNWFNMNHLESPYRKTKPTDTYSLQLAIKLSFNQWLNKRMTMANWGCGIDLMLETYISKNNYGDEIEKIIRDEKQYRHLMTCYAIEDCIAVSKLQKMIDKLTKPAKVN